eukprot:scaffold64028_cov57-Attheya_sp.AAC.2
MLTSSRNCGVGCCCCVIDVDVDVDVDPTKFKIDIAPIHIAVNKRKHDSKKLVCDAIRWDGIRIGDWPPPPWWVAINAHTGTHRP